MARPETLPGLTYKLRWPESDHAIYITVNDIMAADGKGRGVRRPFEVFINSKNMEHYAWTVALTRMISAVFRRGGDVTFVVEELKAVFDPRGGASRPNPEFSLAPDPKSLDSGYDSGNCGGVDGAPVARRALA